MKYIVHKDVATWMRETYEVEVDNDCAHMRDAIINVINGGVDDRVHIESATTPEYGREASDFEPGWTFEKQTKTKLTLEEYVQKNLLRGDRGSFVVPRRLGQPCHPPGHVRQHLHRSEG